MVIKKLIRTCHKQTNPLSMPSGIHEKYVYISFYQSDNSTIQNIPSLKKQGQKIANKHTNKYSEYSCVNYYGS